MELLIFLLLSPAIFAQTFPPTVKSNDEPFLPILPRYPYNLKVLKRGIEQDGVTQLTPELFAPKSDVRDSFTSSYNNNLQGDSYYPSYNLYSKSSTSTISPFFPPSPYTPPPSPYNLLNSYPNPYQSSSLYPNPGPYAPGGSYPNYFYPPPPYPGYYNQPYTPFLPPPPYGRPPKPNYDSDDSDGKEKHEDDKRSESKKSKLKDTNRYNENQYIDGGNFISDSSKDLDGQSSSYKLPSQLNKLEGTDQQKTVLRIINIPAQGQNYLSSDEAKAHLENLMRQTLTKLLSQNVTPKLPYPINLEDKSSQNYVAVPSQTIAKTGLTYVINPGVYNKVNQGQSGQIQPFTKNTKYPSLPYGQKPVTRVTLERSPGVYIAPYKIDKSPSSTQTPDYADYDSPQSNSGDRNANHNQPQDSASYSTQNVATAKAPQSFSYHYSSYQPEQSSDEIEIAKESIDETESKEKSSD